MDSKQQLAYDYLKACFQSRGFHTDNIVSQNSMIRILSSMSNIPFDGALAQELFYQCGTNYRGDILIEDFILVVIEAAQILQQKIHKTNELIQIQARLRNQSHLKLHQSQKTEKPLYGNLGVNVIEAQQLYNGESHAEHKPYVVIQVGNKQLSSNLAHNDKFNPKWNQIFNLYFCRSDIENGEEFVIASVLSLDTLQNTTTLGQTRIPIEELVDQLRVNKWYNLIGARGEKVGGKLHLELQYLTDTKKLYDDSIHTTDQQLLRLEQEKKQFTQDLINLYSPFKREQLKKPNSQIIIDSPALMFVNEVSQPTVFENTKKIDLNQVRNAFIPDIRVQWVLDQNVSQGYIHVDPTQDYPGNFIPFILLVSAQQDLDQKVNWGFTQPNTDMKILAVLVFIYFICSVLVCYLRSDFVNLTISLLISFIIVLNYLDKLFINFFAILLLVVIGFDIVWLAIDQEHLWNLNHPLDLRNYYRFVIVVTYISIFTKLLLAIILYRIKELANYLNSKQQFGIGMYLYNQSAGNVNPMLDDLRK